MRTLKKNDVNFESMRADGPGGQHGDNNATAVRVRIDIDQLPATQEEKEWVKEHAPPRHITKDNELLVQNGSERSQVQNKKRALEIINKTIQQAITDGKQEKKSQKRKQKVKNNNGGGGSGEEDLHKKQKRKRRQKNTKDYLEEAYQQAPDRMDKYITKDQKNKKTS